MIRLAQSEDLPEILEIFRIARAYMAQQGNAGQWGPHHPSQALLEEDIAAGRLYVCTQQGKIHGVFAFIIGDDPTYQRIENGAWRDCSPYGALHRIASDGRVKGVFSQCMAYCKGQIGHLRIDTHQNNQTMRHLIEKHGFVHCGTIYVQDGTPRLAYEYTQPGSQSR